MALKLTLSELEKERTRLQKLVDNFKRDETLLTKQLDKITSLLALELPAKDRSDFLQLKALLEEKKQQKIAHHSHLAIMEKEIKRINSEIHKITSEPTEVIENQDQLPSPCLSPG